MILYHLLIKCMIIDHHSQLFVLFLTNNIGDPKGDELDPMYSFSKYSLICILASYNSRGLIL